jgi:hypothetical protein
MGDWLKDRRIYVGRTLIDVHFIVRHGDPTKLKRPDEAMTNWGQENGSGKKVGRLAVRFPDFRPSIRLVLVDFAKLGYNLSYFIFILSLDKKYNHLLYCTVPPVARCFTYRNLSFLSRSL